MYDPFTARFVSDISLSGLMTQYLHESHTSEVCREHEREKTRPGDPWA